MIKKYLLFKDLNIQLKNNTAIAMQINQSYTNKFK